MNKNNRLTQFNTGNSHENNPLGGIPIGFNNSVEENETKIGNFVYSNRIFLDSNIVSQYNLPKSLTGKSVADATKMIDDKFKGRNDKISQSTKNSMLSKIAEAQEAMKPQEPEMEQSQGDMEQSYSQEMMDNGQMAWGGFADSTIGQGFSADATGAQQSQAIGAGLGVGMAAMDLGKTAFGKPNIDTSGQFASEQVNSNAMIGSSALKGATAGMAFGPWGAGIGAVVGAGAGWLGAGKAEKAAMENSKLFAINTNKKFSDKYFAYGGEINPPATRQDSLALKNDSLRLLKEYQSKGYKPSNVNFPNTNLKDAFLQIQKRKDIPGIQGITQVIRNGIRRPEKYNPTDYRQEINQNQFRQREAANGVLNADIIPALYDKRIQPTSYLKLMGQEGASQNDGVNIPYYGDMKVSPENPVVKQPTINSFVSKPVVKPVIKQATNVLQPSYAPKLTAKTNQYREQPQQIMRDNTRVGTSFNTIDPRILKKASNVQLAYGGKMNQMEDGGYYDKNKPYFMTNPGPTNINPTIGKTGFYGPDIIPKQVFNDPSELVNIPEQVTKPTQTQAEFENYANQHQKIKPSFGQKVWEGTRAVGKYGYENAGNLARYAPIAANALQLAQLKKPQAERLDRLANRYKPEYVDEAQLQNIANQTMNNSVNAIGQSGASQGQLRSSIIGSQLQRTKAISDAYSQAANQNRATNDRAQTFNLGVDQVNLQQSNSEKDINARNQGAYDTEKSKLIGKIGENIGNVGTEQAYKKIAKTTTGYSWLGEFQKANPNATKEETVIAAKKAGVTIDDDKTTKKNALGGYLIKNKVR